MNRWLALSFALPALIMAFAFACHQVWPFGDKTALTIDLYHMYAPLIAHLHDIIYEGAGGAWSWNIGGGINYFTLYLTNVGSPLNALIALFPKTWMPDLVGLGMVVKAGLTGLCMGWLLRFKWRSCDGWTPTFAAMYALCGWAVNYYWNIMWADLLFLLPLCLLGIELIIGHGRWGVYLAALAGAMVCNYYIAVLMCVFLLLYFIVAVLSRFSLLREKRWIIGRSLLFGCMSLLAAGIAAACLLPVAQALTATSVVSDANPGWKLFHAYGDVLKNTLPGAVANIRSGGLPHIYAGWLCVWLLPLYLTDRRAGLKWRILSLLALGGIIGVMNIKALDFIWHGLHTPNDLPFRYSFCISALLVIMAYPAARRINRRTLPALFAWGGSLLAALAISELTGDSAANLPRLISVAALLLTLSVVLWLCFVRGSLKVPAARLLILGLVCIELAWGATWGVQGSATTSRSYYVGNIRSMSAAAQVVQALGEGGLFRAETAKYMTLNDPALYGLKGLSHFSSMLDAGLQDLMHKLGYQSFMHGNVRANRQAGQPNTPVVDSLLGVRYLIAARSDDLDALNEGLLEAVWTDGTNVVYENPWALPLAFAVEEDTLTAWSYKQNTPFGVQRDFIQLATGTDDVLRNLREYAIEGDELSFSRSSENNYRFHNSQLANPGSAVLSYVVNRTSQLYFYADGDQMTNITLTVRQPGEGDEGDTVVRTASSDGRYPKVLQAGPVEPGQEVEVRITLGRTRTDSTVRAYMVSLDEAAFQAAFTALQAGGLGDIQYGNSYVRGVIEAGDGMALMTTIPADGGWTLYIDGRESEIIRVGGAFIGALLPAGQHEIELRWMLPGFDAGFKISLISLMLLLLFWAVTRLEPLRPAPAGAVYIPRIQTAAVPKAAEPDGDEVFDGTAGQDLTAYWLDEDEAQEEEAPHE